MTPRVACDFLAKLLLDLNRHLSGATHAGITADRVLHWRCHCGPALVRAKGGGGPDLAGCCTAQCAQLHGLSVCVGQFFKLRLQQTDVTRHRISDVRASHLLWCYQTPGQSFRKYHGESVRPV